MLICKWITNVENNTQVYIYTHDSEVFYPIEFIYLEKRCTKD